MQASSSPHDTEEILSSRALGKTMSSLAESAALRKLFMYVRGQVWQVMTPDESPILRAHFPPQNGRDGFALLPLTGMVALRALMYNEYTIDCVVGEAIFPGENIRMERGEILIHTPAGRTLNAITFKRWTYESGKIGQGFTIPTNVHMTEYGEFSLPQGEDFRFVNGVSVSENGEFFAGRYDLTSNFDIALLPELVAQIGLAAGSACKKLKLGELCFYKGGKFNFATHMNLEGVASLHLSAKVIPREAKRDLSYTFSLRTNTGVEIFWGQVDGTRVKYATLIEGLGQSKTSREGN